MTKTAFVTGGAGGIGAAVCRELADEGFRIFIGYNRSEKAADSLCEELKAGGVDAFCVSCDVADSESVQKAVQFINGVSKGVDVLVNNAGIAEIGLFTDMTDERLFEMINTDLLGAMRVTKALLPGMIARHSGSIINISSVWGEKGASCEVAYSAAKAGLNGFTAALARETAPSGVRVNAVSCGFIDTKMNKALGEDDRRAILDEIPLGRFGTPEDIAKVVRFLAGERSAYICGQVIRADGGWV